MILSLSDLSEILSNNYSPEDIPDIVGVSSSELVEYLEEAIDENRERIYNRLVEDGVLEEDE